MSNEEHLFENALVALENDYYFGEWKRIEKDRHNTDGVSEEVLEAIWKLAIYTKYTYESSLNAIPIEWLQKKYDKWKDRDMLGWSYCIKLLIEDWEKENGEKTV